MAIKHFPDILRHWAKTRPQAPAVAVGDRVILDYKTLAMRVSRLAAGLQASGLKNGDRVALVLPNCVSYFEIILGCWHAGLVAVPVNAKLHASEFEYILESSGAALCFYSESLRSSLPASLGTGKKAAVCVDSPDYSHWFREPTDPVKSLADGVAWLFYTSGTTGKPKGAMITHANLWSMCDCYFADVDDVAPWTAILHPAPLSHGSGLYALAHLKAGSCQVLTQSGSFDPTEVFALIKTWPNAVFFAAPTMIRRLVEHPLDVDTGHLKSIIYGGAPMYLQDIKAYLDRFGPKLAQLYGQGESPMTITALSQSVFKDNTHPRWEARIASAGTAQSLVSVRTIDENGREVETGDIGEIVVKGTTVMKGYWNDPPATTSALQDGWLKTGDLGTFDDDGFLTLKDRSKDLIISGGSNVYPREVEEVLLRHPGVTEVSVIGSRDREWGERVVAYVVRGVESSERTNEQLFEQLDQLCLQSIARFKRPRKYRLIDTLPKNNYGKVLKRALRDLERDHQDI